MKIGLTPKQQQVYDFLRLFHKVNGYYPTMRQIGEGVIDGEQVMPRRPSANSSSKFLDALVERGWIEKLPGRANAIRML